jgi:hypothetical protein
VGQHPDAEQQLRQLFKVLCDIEDVAGYTPASVGESEQWSSIVSTVEENCANFCKALSGKTLYRALYGIYTVTLNELKGLLKTRTTAKNETTGASRQEKASRKFADVSGITHKRRQNFKESGSPDQNAPIRKHLPQRGCHAEFLRPSTNE